MKLKDPKLINFCTISNEDNIFEINQIYKWLGGEDEIETGWTIGYMGDPGKPSFSSCGTSQYWNKELSFEDFKEQIMYPEKKVYEFNENDLIVFTERKPVWVDKGEICRIGGKQFTQRRLSGINKQNSMACTCKSFSSGNGCRILLDFRHANQEEVDYYNRVGIGANINDLEEEKALDPLSRFVIGNWYEGFGQKTIGKLTGSIDKIKFPSTEYIADGVLYTDGSHFGDYANQSFKYLIEVPVSDPRIQEALPMTHPDKISTKIAIEKNPCFEITDSFTRFQQTWIFGGNSISPVYSVKMQTDVGVKKVELIDFDEEDEDYLMELQQPEKKISKDLLE